MDKYRVTFLPDAADAWVPAGTTLLAAAAAAHVAIDAPCGDRGICGKCKVQVVSPPSAGEGQGESRTAGHRTLPYEAGEGSTRHSAPTTQHPALAPPTLPERTLIPPDELAQGWRLACQATVSGSVTVRVPERALKPAVVPMSQIEPRPAVRKLHLRLPQPTIDDAVSDLSRLRRGLAARIAGHPEPETRPPDPLGVKGGGRSGQHGGGQPGPNRHHPERGKGFAAPANIDLPFLQRLPSALTSASYDVTAVLAGDRLLTLEPGDTTSHCFGLAVDLGTTSVVAMLVDLPSGRTVGVESRLNGQANYGADVISRITFASQQPDGLQILQSAAVSTINAALATLVQRTGVDARQIYETVVVGNTCMSHLLLGIDPRSLALAPYQAVVSDAVSCRGAELGLDVNPEGVVYTLPNIAGFVGSDTVAVILATALHRSEEIRLAIDLGTNGEMVLGNRDRLLACSTAAGPAFEGARITCGMRATEGAIERVWIADGEVKLQVIGGGPPLGLCGSGLLDAVAQMLDAGLVNSSGRLIARDMLDSSVAARLARRLVRNGGGDAFTLARRGRRPVALTQADVRELQLAKGAIRAGISIMLKEFGIEEGDIAEILLAGAFGSYVSPASARALGLIPPLPIDRITAVGNAAGQGAVMALVSIDQREQATRIARSAEHLELSARPDFMDQFMSALALR